MDNNAFTEVQTSSMEPGAAIIPLGELYSIKAGLGELSESLGSAEALSGSVHSQAVFTAANGPREVSVSLRHPTPSRLMSIMRASLSGLTISHLCLSALPSERKEVPTAAQTALRR